MSLCVMLSMPVVRAQNPPTNTVLPRALQAGTSTVFLVIERQTDLITAQGRELQTQTDLNKSDAQLQCATGNR